LDKLGIVVIGRNEGTRLLRCLESVSSQCEKIVYVDSGSTDNSVSLASRFATLTVTLDASQPFTAARSRNAGFEKLVDSYPEIEFVQFMDGDCEITPDWLTQGIRFLRSNADVAIVAGHLKEKYPVASIYNMICDIEWEAPVGEAKSCGGIKLARTSAFAEAKGYQKDLIAGEESDLCIRLRRENWKIWHMDCHMAVHDASIHHFHQWWKRMVRGGYAFTQGAFLHGKSQERHWVRESLSVTAWAALIPFSILLMAIAISPWCLFLFMVYPVQFFRITRSINRSQHEKMYYALFVLLGKFAEFQGQLGYFYDKLRNRRREIIEYKAG